MKMKYTSKFLTLFTLFFVIHLNAQSISDVPSLDQDFLDSLPESVQDDLVKEMEDERLDKKNVQKRPSTEILKYETIQNWEKFKKQQSLDNLSERYGLKIFNSMQSSFMPLNEPNFGNNYIIDYGDSIEIDTFGSENSNILVEVKRDGTVFIEGIGSVRVAGLNFEQVTKLIESRFKGAYTGIDISVSLSSIRDINVMVTGNVPFPGIYTLSGNSNILQALNIVGGINENGSLRNIVLRRNNSNDQSIDLYQALLLGKIDDVPFLMSGDSIHVNSAGNLVRAGSGFNNPAVFEMRQGETLGELIKYSGGLKNEVNQKMFNVVRFENDEFVSYEVDFSESSSFIISHLDSIYANKQAIGAVEITGNVMRPGKYSISSSDKLLDIINRAGGYNDSAYPFAGVLLREGTKELEKLFAEKAYRNLISFIATVPQKNNESTGGNGLAFLLSEIKEYEPEGRVVVELNQSKLESNIQDNIYLVDGDKIHIPAYLSNVYIFGEVGNPGSVTFKEGYNLYDYINKSGGLTRFSSKKSAFIVSPNGETSQIHLNGLKKYLAGESFIYPGSVIYVPRHIGLVEGVDYYATIAPIFSSLALSLASLNSISN